MLSRILHEFGNAAGSVDLDELSRRVGVQRSGLEGMIEFLVRKRYLREVRMEEAAVCAACSVRSTCEPSLGVRFWEMTEDGRRRLARLQDAPQERTLLD
jgi:hypothetical protein